MKLLEIWILTGYIKETILTYFIYDNNSVVMFSESYYSLEMHNKIFTEEIIWFLEETNRDIDETRLSMSQLILNKCDTCKKVHYTISVYLGIGFKLP